MLETVLKTYTMAMATGVRSPLPHLVGPPGCGKSTVVETVAEMIGVNMHTVNVSRISPLEIEGVQMPQGEGADMRLYHLLATYWADLEDNDILLLDEFLRGFPPVYNGLLDIITSRRVGKYQLPKVFIIAASNSNITYDKALDDRLVHIYADDPRNKKGAKKLLARLIVEQLGLLPSMATSRQMESLLDTEVLPMFKVLDDFSNKTASVSRPEGHSVRHLIGLAQLRQVESVPLLQALLETNNHQAMTDGKPQYVFLFDGVAMPPGYEKVARAILGNEKVGEKQALNLKINLDLIETEAIRNEKEEVIPDDPILAEIFD
jgi:hypothetical protein